MVRPIRRKFLRAIGALSLTGCAVNGTQPGTAVAAGNTGSKTSRTPAEPLGPFYPVNWSGDIDGNLVQLDQQAVYNPAPESGESAKVAAGERLVLTGRITRGDGKPAAGAVVDIWQTDHTGHYRHPGDAGEAPAERGFQGYGRVKTDNNGQYEFVTVKPAPYESRPAHIHFRIEDGSTTLITQMYFAGENTEGGIFARIGSSIWASNRDVLTINPVRGDDRVARGQFDIFL